MSLELQGVAIINQFDCTFTPLRASLASLVICCQKVFKRLFEAELLLFNVQQHMTIFGGFLN